jgi:hypothetical protein
MLAAYCWVFSCSGQPVRQGKNALDLVVMQVRGAGSPPRQRVFCWVHGQMGPAGLSQQQQQEQEQQQAGNQGDHELSVMFAA